MSYEDKAMASPSTSLKLAASEILNLGSLSCMSSGTEPVQDNQQCGTLNGPVVILWDIENCPVPSDVRPEDVAGNIRMALRVHPVIKGAVTMFSAYGDFNAFPRRLREGCQRTGVKLVDVPNGRKDAADKAILVDMFLFALDNRPPSSMMLISGDVDFAPALHILGQRGYTIILVIPSGVGVSSALSNAGRFVWDWPSVARGESFVPPKTSMNCGPDLSGYVMSCNLGDSCNVQNEDEAIVYRGTFQSEYGAQATNQAYFYNSMHVSTEPVRTSQSLNDHFHRNATAGPYFTSSRSQSVPPASVEGPPIRDQNFMQEQGWWVRPGDIQGLKGQIVGLLEIFGGSLPLVRVPSEYLKFFGRPLYMSEYGVHKLVDLIKKMSDSLIVLGKGHKKMLCLRYPADRHFKKCLSTPAMTRKDDKGKGLEENVDTSVGPNLASSSDEFSDCEKNDDPLLHAAYEFEELLETLRQEVQELLVCYSCPVPLNIFESLYEQRYKKVIDYQSFGMDSLEELIHKLKDVVELHEDQYSKKFIISTFIS